MDLESIRDASGPARTLEARAAFVAVKFVAAILVAVEFAVLLVVVLGGGVTTIFTVTGTYAYSRRSVVSRGSSSASASARRRITQGSVFMGSSCETATGAPPASV
jgi:hypothetical protein